MDWTDEVIERLRSLWAEGHSTAEIGRRLGVSKNAVVGKAHRLALPPRPSPIRRDGAISVARRGVPRPVGTTLPHLGAVSVRGPVMVAAPAERAVPQDDHRPGPPVPRPHLREAGARDAGLQDANPREPSPREPSPRESSLRDPSLRGGRSRRTPCCWPIGEPGTKSFRFCDGASVAGKPYCPEHAALAYVKIRDRREEAA